MKQDKDAEQKTDESEPQAQPEIAEEEQTEDAEEKVEEETESQQTDIEKLEAEFEEYKVKMEAEVETAKDRMLRAAADFENYKKRAVREKNDFMKYVAEGFVTDVLPILDNLERAIDTTTNANSAPDFASFREGVKLIHKQLTDVLEKRNVIKIEAVGEPFDPNVHEAIMPVKSDEFPANTVVEEFQKGYMLYDKVIRPAMVSVSMGNDGEEGEENE